MSPVVSRELLAEQCRLLKYYAEVESRKEKTRSFEYGENNFEKYAKFIKFLNTT